MWTYIKVCPCSLQYQNYLVWGLFVCLLHDMEAISLCSSVHQTQVTLVENKIYHKSDPKIDEIC